MTPRLHTFGDFTYDAALGVLMSKGMPVRMGHRATRLLGALLEHRGTIVPTDMLMERVWKGQPVEPGNLSVQVATLRRVLGAPSSEWITTVHRVGYRFAAAIAGPVVMTEASPWPSLAVLPFTDLGSDEMRPSFGDGVVEDLTTALAGYNSVAVVARNSSAQYGDRPGDVRAAAADLGARYVLEGSVRGSPGRLRVSGRLIDGETGTHLFGQNFDAPAGWTAADQDTLVGGMAAVIEERIHAHEILRSRRGLAPRSAAYDHYLKGRLALQSSRADDNATAQAHFAEALELEPDNSAFLAAAAEAVHHRTTVGWEPLQSNARRHCYELTQRGLDSVGIDAVATVLVGISMFSADEEDLGVAITRRAVELNNHNPLVLVAAGLSDLWTGSLEEAETKFARAAALNAHDPARRFAFEGLAHVARIREDFDASLDWAARSFAACPGLSATNWHLIALNALSGRMAEARRHLTHYRKISPGVTIASIREGQRFRDQGRLTSLIDGLKLAGMPLN